MTDRERNPDAATAALINDLGQDIQGRLANLTQEVNARPTEATVRAIISAYLDGIQEPPAQHGADHDCSLELIDIHGLGPASAGILAEHGIVTFGQLASADAADLAADTAPAAPAAAPSETLTPTATATSSATATPTATATATATATPTATATNTATATPTQTTTTATATTTATLTATAMATAMATNTPIAVPEGVDSVTVDQLSVAILLEDFDLEDGDRISLTLSNNTASRTLLADLTLTNTPYPLVVTLEVGVNLLTVVTLDTGARGPATVAVTISNVIAGESRQEFRNLQVGEVAQFVIQVSEP